MSKNYKVRNGLKYMPVKQYNPNGTLRATRIEVAHTKEPDTPSKPSSRAVRFKLFLQDLARGAAYALSR
jgi:hypothetical protein